MNNRRLAVILVAVLLVLAAGAGGAWFLFLRGDNVAPLGLSASPRASAPAGGGAAVGGATTSAGGPLAGAWTVREGVAGYRVRETFLQQQADSDAVGRSPAVTGSATVSGTAGALSLDAATFTVDLTALKSDRGQRDGQLRQRALETSTFPDSTFVLAGPVALPATFGSTDVDVTLPGKLTLHGVTRDVRLAAQARLDADGSVIVAGTLPITFADWQIEAPNVAGMISVQDHGSLEFRIVLARS